METKRFDVRTVLTSLTGTFLCRPVGPSNNGIGDLYAMLGWMTSQEPHSNQLGRFNDECVPWLRKRFPELEQAGNRVSELEGNLKGNLRRDEVEAVIVEWIARIKFDTGMKDFYDVPKIPADYHERKCPYDELVAMRGTDEGVIVVNKRSENPCE